jgi:hypothetical protein
MAFFVFSIWLFKIKKFFLLFFVVFPITPLREVIINIIRLNTNMRSFVQEEIYNIYKHDILLNEVASKFVDEVKEYMKEGPWPFQNIFGDALRIVIPLMADSTLAEIMKIISKIKNYAGVDLKKGEVFRKVKTDPKYGQSKDQKVNIGRIINKLDIDPEKKKLYLNYLARYKDNITEDSEYSILLSRSPIDILRMGEIGNIGHCHQQGNTYFKCAIQEAKTGGAIAFVVKTADIINLSDEQLEDEEIFTDSDRYVDGIQAVSRLRIRKYNVYDDEKNYLESFAVPEIKVYGKAIPYFYDTVLTFLKSKDGLLNDDDYIYQKFKDQLITRSGGSYPDTSEKYLFKSAFQDERYSDIPPTKAFVEAEDEAREDEPDYDDIENRVDVMENELDEIERPFRTRIKHCYHEFSVNESDEGDPYYTVRAFLPINNINSTIKNGEYTISDILRYKAGGEYRYERYMPRGYTDPREVVRIKSFLREFNKLANLDNFYSFSEMSINNKQDQVVLDFQTDDVSYHDVSDYGWFLEEIEKYDKRYNEIQQALIQSLKNNGLLNNLENELKHMVLYQKKLTFTTNIGQAIDKGVVIPRVYSNFVELFFNYIFNYWEYQNQDKLKEQTPLLKFDKFYENFRTNNLSEYGISGVDIETNGDTVKLEIFFQELKQFETQFIKFLDNNTDDIRNMLKLAFLMEMEDSETLINTSLFKAYNK